MQLVPCRVPSDGHQRQVNPTAGRCLSREQVMQPVKAKGLLTNL